MSILNKAGFALVALSALGLTTSAHAFTSINVAPTVTPLVGSGPFTYSYAVTPIGFNANQIGFTFSDSNVTFSSVTGPASGFLNDMSETPVGSGNFINFSSTKGKSLGDGTTETIVFTSTDGPHGTLGVGGSGISTGSVALGPPAGAAAGGAASNIVGPSPVPEASTTASFGLLLALGLGGLAIAARKKSVKA